MKSGIRSTLLIAAIVFIVILIGILVQHRDSGASVDNARQLIRAGKFPEAFRMYQLYCAGNPSDIDAKIEFARLLIDHNEQESGLIILRSLLERFPRDPRLTGLAAEIIRTCDQLTSGMTDSGFVCSRRNEYSGAEQFYRKALVYAEESARWQSGVSDTLSTISRSRLRDARVNYAYSLCLSSDTVAADSVAGPDRETILALAVRLSMEAHTRYDRNDFGGARALYVSACRYLEQSRSLPRASASLLAETYYSLGMTEVKLNLNRDANPDFRKALSCAPPGFYLTQDIRSMIVNTQTP